MVSNEKCKGTSRLVWRGIPIEMNLVFNKRKKMERRVKVKEEPNLQELLSEPKGIDPAKMFWGYLALKVNRKDPYQNRGGRRGGFNSWYL